MQPYILYGMGSPNVVKVAIALTLHEAAREDLLEPQAPCRIDRTNPDFDPLAVGPEYRAAYTDFGSDIRSCNNPDRPPLAARDKRFSQHEWQKPCLDSADPREDLQVAVERAIVRNARIEDRNGYVESGSVSCLPDHSRGQQESHDENGENPDAGCHSTISPVLQTRFMLSVSTQLKSGGNRSNFL